MYNYNGYKGGGLMGGSELGREIFMQMGMLQFYGMDFQLILIEWGLVKYLLLMDKIGLMVVYMWFMKQFGELECDWQLMKDVVMFKGIVFEFCFFVCKKIVEGMCVIILVEFKVGKCNYGCVFYVCICVDIFFLSLIQMLVEDDEGYVVCVMIDDVIFDGFFFWVKVQKWYFKGVCIVIKVFFLFDFLDEFIVLYVNSEEDIVVLFDFNLFIVEIDFWEGMDVVVLCVEGNQWFVKGDWLGVISFYILCIQKVMSLN